MATETCTANNQPCLGLDPKETSIQGARNRNPRTYTPEAHTVCDGETFEQTVTDNCNYQSSITETGTMACDGLGLCHERRNLTGGGEICIETPALNGECPTGLGRGGCRGGVSYGWSPVQCPIGPVIED